MKNIFFIIISSICSLSSCVQQRAGIEPPLSIGTPPQNAYTGLVLLEDGEIRHYGKNMYISSKDNGQRWDTVTVANGNLYGKRSPKTGEYIRLFFKGIDSVYSARSSGGIDGKWEQNLIDTNGAIMLKPVVFIKNGDRAVVGFHTKYRNGCGTYYSDDHGFSWKKSNQVNVPQHQAKGFHKGQRWNHGAVEPSIIELKDGRLWMLIRTAQDTHYESYSSDGGESWSKATPSRFYGTITMPTLQRLRNGSILLIWSNTTPLPELEHESDYWEDVFTNRDALHAAVSDDDGKTWKGFREVYLNPLRNDSLMATRYGKRGSNDRSVQQSEIIDIGNNKVIVSLGQHPNFRTLIKLDINWLYETEYHDDFSNGLTKWSYHKYIKGIKGHCTYNRKPGAFLIPHPDQPFGNTMLLKAERDTTLVAQNSGALFNFPAKQRGAVQVKIKLNKDFKGMQISLNDRWFNPIDTVANQYAMFNIEIPQDFLPIGTWYDVKLEWANVNNSNTGYCTIFINNKKLDTKIPLKNKTINGISYIHFALPLKNERSNSILIESIKTN
ncbi:sialidase family protein [Maribacter antarcticus]|uniref:sialidase family protein n=1 Tax=Maribacter antarcticus TaxID=505250 RepID=UPI000688400B|nr:sialidase family protein [Maribacter antarcticus]